MSATCIYALVDPFTEEIRYIGKSIRPQERLTNHCNEQSVNHRTNWIRSVLAQGARPSLRILEKVPMGASWQEAERRWIAHGREQGWPLTNGTVGGDGVEGLPDDVRQRMRLVWLGRKHKPESLLKIAAASRGRKHTQEWRERMHEAMKDRQFSAETRQRISNGVSKLTTEQVDEIHRLLAQKVSQYAIADMFHVHQGTISNIKRGRFYKSVEVEATA